MKKLTVKLYTKLFQDLIYWHLSTLPNGGIGTHYTKHHKNPDTNERKKWGDI